MYASVFSVTRCTPTPTPTPAVPAIESVAAIESSWYWLPAATRTDCRGSAPATLDEQSVPQLICAALPMCAVVSVETTATAPDRFTAAVPAKPALTPTTARSSLFVAVTLTPLNESASGAIVRGPVSLASPEGCDPDLTMLCDRPVPFDEPSVMAWTVSG